MKHFSKICSTTFIKGHHFIHLYSSNLIFKTNLNNLHDQSDHRKSPRSKTHLFQIRLFNKLDNF